MGEVQHRQSLVIVPRIRLVRRNEHSLHLHGRTDLERDIRADPTFRHPDRDKHVAREIVATV
jgi:hypothetical protein